MYLVYHRKPLNSFTDTKKLLIYLRGGGACVPFVPGQWLSGNTASPHTWPGFESCTKRCEREPEKCTGWTEPYLDLDTHYSHSIFSQDPAENPAFHDFNIGTKVVWQ